MYNDINNCYPLILNKKRKNGCCGIGLIIVNFFEKFRAYDKIVRKGAEEEVKVLKQLFESFNLEVREHTELTKDQIVKQLSETVKDPNLRSDSMIAIAISSHGVEEGLLGINIEDRLNDPDYKSMDDCISPRQIQEIFNGVNCRALAGKPKLFLLNGCRGRGVELMIEIEGEGKDELASDAIFPVPSSEESIATTWSDFFVIYSSFLGNVSLRNTTTGSLFIVEFSKAYAEYGQNYPIESIMPTINRNLIIVCKRMKGMSKQSCIWESTCTRSLRIPPPLKGRIPSTEVRDDPSTISPTHRPDSNNPISSTGEQVSFNYRPSGSEKVSNPIPTLASASQGQQANGNPTYQPNEMNRNPTSYPPPEPIRLMHSSMEKGYENPKSNLSGLVVAKSGEIYVTDPDNECIWIFPNDVNSKVLEFPSNKFSVPDHGLKYCHGICVKDDFLFVTCDNRILKLACTSGLLLDSRLTPTSLTGLDTYGDKIYVCEQFTCQILVLDVNFKIPGNKLDLTSAKINSRKDRLLDIKVFSGEIYVLISGTEYAIQMFNKEGVHFHNVISSSSLKKCNFFMMNRDNKIFAGDLTTNELKVFSNESALLMKRDVFGENPGDLITIGGIDINSNNDVVIACICNTKCVLRKF